MQIWWREKSDWKDKQQQNLETAGNHADSEGKGPECPSTISPRKPAGKCLQGSFFSGFPGWFRTRYPSELTSGLGGPLLSGIPLLFPWVSVGVIAVSLPETQPIMIK